MLKICFVVLLAWPLLGQQFRMQELAKGLGVVYAVRLADVNGDGKQDVVAITGEQVIWYRNPDWQARVISQGAAPKDHVAIAAHDINGDGRLDFALAAEWAPRERAVKGTLHWLEQKADGSFALHDVAKIPGAHRMRWGDVNGDGKKELVVMPLEGKALVYSLPDWKVETAAEGLELAHNLFLEDLDDDGVLDVVMASKAGVESLQRGKDGQWTRRKLGEGQPGEIQIGRVNGYRVAATIEAFHGDQMVIYEEPGPKLNAQGAAPPLKYHSAIGTVWPRSFVDPTVYGGHALGWGDFDGDGSDELAFAYRVKQTGVALLKRTIEGKWERVAKLDGEGMSSEDLVVGDLDGDGRPEVVACGRATGNVRIYWNEWKPKWVRHEVARGFKNYTAVGLKLNGGGKERAVITNDTTRTLLYAGKAVVELHKGVNLIHSAVMDVDGDGDEDFVGARYSPGYVYWLEQPRKPLEEAWKFHLIEDSEKGGIDGVHGLYVADVDGDGRQDLIANSGQPKGPLANSIVWLKAVRKGEAWERTVFARGDAPGLSHYHGAGDLNGDGRVDIVSAAKVGPEGNWFAWWEQGKKGEGWKKHLLSGAEDGATNALVADLNGDGQMDILASRGHGVGLLWFAGPAFAAREIDRELVGPHSLAIGDMDGDGDVDAVTCAKDSRLVAWFENDGQGGFTKRHIFELQAAYDIRLVDMDGDGDLDVLVGGQESANVVWFENRLKG
jgi:hypothetical protein